MATRSGSDGDAMTTGGLERRDVCSSLGVPSTVRGTQTALDQLGNPTRLRLTVAGDGPLEDAMNRFVKRHRMSDTVRLVGRLPRRDVRTLLGNSRAFVAPADLESFGMAALEARWAGLPVVAKARGGVGEFVRHEKEGLLCSSDGQMAHALVRLARDPVLRRAMAAHNRTSGCLVGWDAQLPATDYVYDHASRLQHSAARRPASQPHRQRS